MLKLEVALQVQVEPEGYHFTGIALEVVVLEWARSADLLRGTTLSLAFVCVNFNFKLSAVKLPVSVPLAVPAPPVALRVTDSLCH